MYARKFGTLISLCYRHTYVGHSMDPACSHIVDRMLRKS